MVRLDRFLTLYVFKHLMRVLPQPKGIRIPILMYHSISDEPEKGHPYFWINTSPKRFAEQMKFLADNHYKVISLSEAVDIITDSRNDQSSKGLRNGVDSGNPNPVVCSSQHLTLNTQHFQNLNNPSNPVVLTFDDGYKDFYVEAYPVLSRHVFAATVFLPTGFIGNERAGLRGKVHLNWDEIRELQKHGVSFGSHTVSHPQLLTLEEKAIDLEIRGSKQEIEHKTGREVTSFSYPFRFPLQDDGFVLKLRHVLQEAGYRNGVSTQIGMAAAEESLFFLSRLPVNTADDLTFFQRKLGGAYNWMSGLQKGCKSLKRELSGSHV